jgi:hypothetical protein
MRRGVGFEFVESCSNGCLQLILGSEDGGLLLTQPRSELEWGPPYLVDCGEQSVLFGTQHCPGSELGLEEMSALKEQHDPQQNFSLAYRVQPASWSLPFELVKVEGTGNQGDDPSRWCSTTLTRPFVSKLIEN